jgi:hypothetical protein
MCIGPILEFTMRGVQSHRSFMWEDPDKADGRRTRLKSFYYIMNNLISSTLNLMVKDSMC